MKKILFNDCLKKNILFYAVLLLVFIGVACIYCLPELQNQVIAAGDLINGTSAVQESVNFREATGESTFWTNSMFGGMPNYQIGGYRYITADLLNPVIDFFHSGHRNSIFVLLFYFIAFYILLRAFDVNKWISIAGSFATSFSSYFLVIIGAAHGGKTSSITWMSLVLVGMLLLYRRKYAFGAAMVMFFLMLGFPPHPQMAYYMCMLIGLVMCAELYKHIKTKQMKQWVIATAIFVGSFAVGMGTQMTNNFTNYEYVRETMRGGHSELVEDEQAQQETENGLDIAYATAWSYGIPESLTFLVPNFMGGASGYALDESSELYEALIEQGVDPSSAKNFCAGSPAYWGTQPFTLGPVYMGAIVCFLFVLGLMIVSGPYKWALLVATLFSVFLSWGHNFMWLTELFFNNFPFYNKFRAVSSILIVAEITVPLLAFMSFKVIANKEIEKKLLLKKIQIAALITGGLCLILALMGRSLFNFESPNDAQFIKQIPEWLYGAIIGQRVSMLTADAWRSFIFILAGAAVVWAYAAEKLDVAKTGVLLAILIVVDMWGVNKRFFNDRSFMDKSRQEQVFAKMPYEEVILQDQDPNFRVMNLTTNTFNDARTSYYLKSVGGYSGAKLRRYQDLIDTYLSKMNPNVLNMLNTKYFIVNNEGQATPQLNPEAYGNAWFIDSVAYVQTPTEEIYMLDSVDLSRVAVIDQVKFPDANLQISGDSLATVSLTSYSPRELIYETKSETAGSVVFSEIYYPYGWKAYINEEPVDHYRVNYVLRALNVPAGENQIRFEFDPESVKKGNMLSLICIIIMFATLVAAVVMQVRKR